MFLQPVTEEDILQQVKNAKNKKSKCHDQFDMCLLKKIIPYIVKPLAHICNTSLMNGIFPDRMKIARVIPLFKNGDVKEFSNYRTVSILPQFSKILEKVFHNRLMSFINDKQLLNNIQFGFRNNMYTALALIELVEEITTAIDEGKTTVGVFIDLKTKAFDTVDHNILVNKLEHYRIRGLANNWVCSYIENRRQYVCINDSNSECLDVKCGVPQGFILGPALFILYVNDMCNVSKSLKSILFADDKTEICTGTMTGVYQDREVTAGNSRTEDTDTGIEDEGEGRTEERTEICDGTQLMATHAYTNNQASPVGKEIYMRQWDTLIYKGEHAENEHWMLVEYRNGQVGYAPAAFLVVILDTAAEEHERDATDKGEGNSTDDTRIGGRI